MPTRGIAKGAGVRAEWLVDAPEIARGDSVNVEVRHGGARLSVQAVAESGGRRGDRIALRNPETKRRFLAQVAGKGQAVIEGPSSEGTETK
jgi:flagella basal body P-ring formation protein FlgA